MRSLPPPLPPATHRRVCDLLGWDADVLDSLLDAIASTPSVPEAVETVSAFVGDASPEASALLLAHVTNPNPNPNPLLPPPPIAPADGVPTRNPRPRPSSPTPVPAPSLFAAAVAEGAATAPRDHPATIGPTSGPGPGPGPGSGPAAPGVGPGLSYKAVAAPTITFAGEEAEAEAEGGERLVGYRGMASDLKDRNAASTPGGMVFGGIVMRDARGSKREKLSKGRESGGGGEKDGMVEVEGVGEGEERNPDRDHHDGTSATTSTTTTTTTTGPQVPQQLPLPIVLERRVLNCLRCGKIYDVREVTEEAVLFLRARGRCLFCGERVRLTYRDGRTATEMREGGERVDLAPELLEALAMKDKLVHFDRNSAKRTTVVDDQSDYFASDSTKWLTDEEKRILADREARREAQQEATRKKVTVTLDLLGRQVVVSSDHHHHHHLPPNHAGGDGDARGVDGVDGDTTNEEGGPGFGPGSGPGPGAHRKVDMDHHHHETMKRVALEATAAEIPQGGGTAARGWATARVQEERGRGRGRVVSGGIAPDVTPLTFIPRAAGDKTSTSTTTKRAGDADDDTRSDQAVREGPPSILSRVQHDDPLEDMREQLEALTRQLAPWRLEDGVTVTGGGGGEVEAWRVAGETR